MGCTSSAPPQSPISATDESSGGPTAAAVVHTIQKSEEIQVLPSCNSVHDQQNVIDRNKTPNGTAMDAHFLGIKPKEYNFIQNSNEETKANEEKLSTLEEVVEQVVELYVADNKQEAADSHHEETVGSRNDAVVEDRTVKVDPSEIIDEPKTDRLDDEVGKDDLSKGDSGIADENAESGDSAEQADTAELKEVAELEEMASPSQSTSSRMTRWEALADIAAELPPSLTVDPLTGQIYTLTK